MLSEAPLNIDIQKKGDALIAYRPATSDEKVIGYSFSGSSEYFTIGQYSPKPTDVVINVGAHIGIFSIQLSPLVEKIYAIEPCHDNFVLLQINLALNKCKNVFAREIALSDKTGTCMLYDCGEHWGYSTTAFSLEKKQTCPSYRLENFIRSENIGKIDLLKLNCEGAEFPILLTTPLDILNSIGQIIVLYHLDRWVRNDQWDVDYYLTTAGFKCHHTSTSPYRGWIVATKS